MGAMVVVVAGAVVVVEVVVVDVVVDGVSEAMSPDAVLLPAARPTANRASRRADSAPAASRWSINVLRSRGK